MDHSYVPDYVTYLTHFDSMKKRLFTILLVAMAHCQAVAQGCVAIRSTGGICPMSLHADSTQTFKSNWTFATNSRYFESFRHFRGNEEQNERLIFNTEVINHQFALDLSLTRNLTNQWSVMVDVPLLYNSRSSLYEHGRKERGIMHSFGLGDIRVAAYRWLWSPAKQPKGNL